MKKLVWMFIAMTAICFSACGGNTVASDNTTDTDSVVVDTLDSDSVAVDSVK